MAKTNSTNTVETEPEDQSLPAAPSHRSATGRHVLLSPTRRAQLGKEARAKVPRRDHATFEAPGDRPDPISLLEEQADLACPDLVPIRYGRMLASPFAFYRGAALIMASDLAATPRSGFDVQACGDAHLSNFGIFATPERNLVFDVNDFDETLPGPWEWDVKRLARQPRAIAGRANGFTDAERPHGSSSPLSSRTARPCASSPKWATSAVWYSRFDLEQNLAESGQAARGERATRSSRTC